MPTKHCSWGKCNSDSRYRHKDYMQGVTFSTFPDLLADPKKHKRWIHLCGRADLTTKSTHDPSKARLKMAKIHLYSVRSILWEGTDQQNRIQTLCQQIIRKNRCVINNRKLLEILKWEKYYGFAVFSHMFSSVGTSTTKVK